MSAHAASSLDAYQRASRRFVEIVADVESSASRGDAAKRLLANREIQSLTGVLSDHERFLRVPRYTRDDVATVDALCHAADDATMALARFDLDARIDRGAAAAPLDAQRTAILDANVVAFQPLFRRLMPFAIRCMGVYAPLLDEIVRGIGPDRLDDARRNGALKMQRALAVMYAVALNTANDKDTTTMYRLAVLDVLAEQAPALVPALSRETRVALVELAERARSGAAKGFAPVIDRIVKALLSAPCGALCEVEPG